MGNSRFYFFIKIRIKPTIFNGSFALKSRYSTENDFGRTEPRFYRRRYDRTEILPRMASAGRTELGSRLGSIRPKPRLGLTLIETIWRD